MNYDLGIFSVQNPEYFPFGKQSFFFEDMIRSYKKENMKVFFFSPLDCDGSEIVQGFEYIDDQWKRVKASIPKLIYDRAFSKSEKEKQLIEKCRTWLAYSGRHILNPFGLAHLLNDKMAFHQFLLKNKIPTLETHLINAESIRLEDLEFTDKRIYLKPNFGSKGEGIYVIEKLNPGFKLYDRIGEFSEFNKLSELNDHLQKEGINLSNYFLQEEASTELINDSPFDIRVLVQNYGEDYRITGMGARIGQSKAVTANLNSGGKAMAVDELSNFMKTQFNRNIEEEISEIKEICFQTSQLLQEKLGAFLEIGYDILITHEGPIIIEGNAKPSRWIFNVIADEKIEKGESPEKFHQLRKETVMVPLIYASYLKQTKWNND